MESKLSVARTIQVIGRPVFTSREIATLGGTSLTAASHTLRRMEQRGLIKRAARGLWCVPSDPRFTPFALVTFLAGRHQAYVSFLSAVHLHGMIEQIPQIIYAATTGPTRVKKTPVGTYSFHRIHPNFFTGFDWYRDRRDFLIASPEKALVDSLYLSSRRGKRFRSFPELDLAGPFSFIRAGKWTKRIPDMRIRKYVLEQLKLLRRRNRRALTPNYEVSGRKSASTPTPRSSVVRRV